MGYDPNFVSGETISLPVLNERVKEVALNQGVPIDHTRFSIIFSQERHFAIATAHNIDGDLHPSGGEMPKRSFKIDPDVDSSLQVNKNRGYHKNPWDQGHLVRRHSLNWGSAEEAAKATKESDFWTNIAPQHHRLHSTAWGKIEKWMLELADDSNKRSSIFTGPVFTLDDPEIQNKPNTIPIRIPAGFWKILVIKHDGVLRAAAFLTWQRDFNHDGPVAFDPLLEQVRITTLEFLTGLSFTSLHEADPLHFGVEFDTRRGIRSIRINSARTMKAAITSRDDIVL